MRRVFEGEERGQAVGLKAVLKIRWGGLVNRRRTQQARTAHPHIKATPGVQGLVDKGQGVLL